MADVPNVPGVPRLAAYASGALPALMGADLVTGYGGAQLRPQWGLYRGARAAIVADTVTAMSFRQEWAISKYQLEDGAFESYDRVTQPFDCRLQFVSGKNNANRQKLLRSLDAASADGNMTKYDVVTPEVIYSGVSVAHVDYDRAAAAGLGILKIDVMLQEIREQNTGQQSAQSSSGNAVQTDGTVQAQSPSGADESGFISAFGNQYPENAL